MNNKHYGPLVSQDSFVGSGLFGWWHFGGVCMRVYSFVRPSFLMLLLPQTKQLKGCFHRHIPFALWVRRYTLHTVGNLEVLHGPCHPKLNETLSEGTWTPARQEKQTAYIKRCWGDGRRGKKALKHFILSVAPSSMAKQLNQQSVGTFRKWDSPSVMTAGIHSHCDGMTSTNPLLSFTFDTPSQMYYYGTSALTSFFSEIKMFLKCCP